MQRALIWLFIPFLGTATVVAGQNDKPVSRPAASEQPQSKPQTEPSKVEGVLWCLDPIFPTPEFDAGKPVIVAEYSAMLTGVRLYFDEFGNCDVYLSDERLKQRAQELNGQRVTVTGEIRLVVVVSKWFGDDQYGKEVAGPHGKKIWVPSSRAELPRRRPVIWATDLKPLGPRREPLLGDPTVLRDRSKTYTFKRLPRSTEVTSVKLESSSNARLPDLKLLTVANFPALLDGMKPIPPDDESVRLGGRAAWYYCKFETSEGEFLMQLYLGGYGYIVTPDARVGWIQFEHPK
jgi:hypothetical protein